MVDEKEQLDKAPDFSKFFDKKSSDQATSQLPIYEEAPSNNNSSRFSRIIMFASMGILKTDKQVTFVMIGLVVLCGVLIGFLLLGNSNDSSSAKPGLETFKNAPTNKVPLELRNNKK